MKVLFALYDKNDNFITCGFSLKECGVNSSTGQSWRLQHTTKGTKLYKISLEPQNDVFNEEDKIFIQEEAENVFTISEQAKTCGVSERTIYRRKMKKLKEVQRGLK